MRRRRGVLIVGGGLAGAALRGDAAPPRLRRAGADRLRRARAALRPPAALQGRARRRGRGGRDRLPARRVVRGATRSSCCSARAPSGSTRRARRVVLDGGERAAPTSKLLIATGSAPRGCRSSRASRTSTTCAPSPTRGACGRADPGRPAGDRRRRVHRPGGRGDGARARRRGDDDRGAGDCRSRRSSASELGALVRRPAPRTRASRVLTGAMLERRARRRRVEELLLADGARIDCDAVVVGVGTVAGDRLAAQAAASSAAGVRTRTPRAHGPAGRLRRRRRLASPSTPASAPTPAPSTGTPPPGRAPPPPRRCSARTRARRRCRASGATSTGSASSTSATPTMRDAVVVEGDPAARDFEAVFTRERRPGRRPHRRPAAVDPSSAQANRGGHCRRRPEEEEVAA